MRLHNKVALVTGSSTGIGKACELVFGAKTIDAKEAREIGLVNQVVPAEDLAKVTYEMAHSIAELANYNMSRVRDVVIPNIQKLLKFFRENKLRVFYAQMGPRMLDGSDLYTIRRIGDAEMQKRTGGMRSLWGTWTYEYQTFDAVKPEPGELVFNKRTRSPFVSTGLDHTLRMIGIDGLVMTGGATDCCVLSTALAAIDLGYKGVIVDDATHGPLSGVS